MFFLWENNKTLISTYFYLIFVYDQKVEKQKTPKIFLSSLWFEIGCTTLQGNLFQGFFFQGIPFQGKFSTYIIYVYSFSITFLH
jgi:hypothetical protein